jgi:hypothetical protein
MNDYYATEDTEGTVGREAENAKCKMFNAKCKLQIAKCKL